MKKTIWIPLVLGAVFGVVAGASWAANLTFLAGGWAIGFYVVFYLLAAALGGPISSILSVSLVLIIVIFLGPADIKVIASNPIIFTTNWIVISIELILISFVYRLIFERLKMPTRLLPWIGMVILYYVILVPTLSYSQTMLGYPVPQPVSEFITASYKGYIPQVIADIVITSLIFFALPERYRRPLWYERKKKGGGS